MVGSCGSGGEIPCPEVIRVPAPGSTNFSHCSFENLTLTALTAACRGLIQGTRQDLCISKCQRIACYTLGTSQALAADTAANKLDRTSMHWRVSVQVPTTALGAMRYTNTCREYLVALKKPQVLLES